MQAPPALSRCTVFYCQDGTPTDPELVEADLTARDLVLDGLLALGLNVQSDPATSAERMELCRQHDGIEDHVLLIAETLDTTTLFALQWAGAFQR